MVVPEKYPIQVKNANGSKNTSLSLARLKTTDVPNQCFLYLSGRTKQHLKNTFEKGKKDCMHRQNCLIAVKTEKRTQRENQFFQFGLVSNWVHACVRDTDSVTIISYLSRQI